MEIKLRRVPVEEKARLFAMMQIYIHEFSAFEPVEPDENGIYPYEIFDAYWEEPERIPFFIMADGSEAGLTLNPLTFHSRHLNMEVDTTVDLKQMDYLGRQVLARKNADGAYELSALLSSDPQDFLDPRFAVGSIIG